MSVTNVTVDIGLGKAHNGVMASPKQIGFYNDVLDEIVRRSAPGEFSADAVRVAREAFPDRDVADASETLTTAIATRDRLRAAKPVASTPAAPVAGLDLTGIPSGTYAVPGGETRLKVRIDVITEGKWAGWVFVKDGAVYGEGQKYGSQRPGAAYRGAIENALRAIVADPYAAMAAYGHLTNTCGVCHAPLEQADSVARGIGPVCARKFR